MGPYWHMVYNGYIRIPDLGPILRADGLDLRPLNPTCFWRLREEAVASKPNTFQTAIASASRSFQTKKPEDRPRSSRAPMGTLGTKILLGFLLLGCSVDLVSPLSIPTKPLHSPYTQPHNPLQLAHLVSPQSIQVCPKWRKRRRAGPFHLPGGTGVQEPWQTIPKGPK